MELLLIKEPHQLCFTNNPITFMLAISPFRTAEKAADIKLIVRVEIEDENSIFTPANESVFYPSEDGTTLINIQSIIKAYSTQFIPPLNQNIPCPTEQVNKFRIVYRLLNNNFLVPNSVQTSQFYYAVKGGLSYEQWHPKKYWQTLLANQLFMRYAVKEERVFPNELKFLSWLYPFADGAAQYVKHKIYLDDRTVIEDAVITATDEDIYQENMEWGYTTNATDIDFDYPTTPYSGAKSINVPLFHDGQVIEFISPSALLFSDYASFRFYVKIHTYWYNAMDLQIEFLNALGIVSSYRSARIHAGMNTGAEEVWQELIFPISGFALTDTAFDRIRIRMNYGNDTGASNPVQFDNIRLLAALGTQDLPSKQFATYITPAGFDQLRLADLVPAGKTAMIFSTEVINQTGAQICLPQFFFLDYRNFYDTRDLMYVSSLGTIETMRLRGEIDAETEYQRINADKATPPDYFNNTLLDAAVEVSYNSELEIFRGDTGFLHKDELDKLRDLLNARSVFEIKKNRLFPVNILSKSSKWYTNKQNLYSVAIEWQHAFVNENYSPADLIAVGGLCPAIETFIVRQSGRKLLTISYALETGYNKIQVQITVAGVVSNYVFIGNTGQKEIDFVNPAADGTVSLSLLYTVVNNGDGTQTVTFDYTFAGTGIVWIQWVLAPGVPGVSGYTSSGPNPISLTMPVGTYNVQFSNYHLDGNPDIPISTVFQVIDTITTPLVFTDAGTATINIKAKTVCNDLTEPQDLGPETNVDLAISGNIPPTATDDHFNVTPEHVWNTLPRSVLENDYDSEGDAVTAVPASGTTAQGGDYGIDAAGIVTYRPAVGFTGTDTFVYSITDGTLTDPATVYISVLFAEISSLVYIKITARNIHKSNSGIKTNLTGDWYVEFYSDAAGTTPMDVTGLVLPVTLRKHTNTRGASPVNVYTDSTITAVGYEMKIFSGLIKTYSVWVDTTYFELTFALVAGAGYYSI